MFNAQEERDSATRMQGIGLGLVIGAMLGAGAALLFAPAAGEETRKRLARRAQRAVARGEDVLEDAWEATERRARRLAKQGAQAASRVVR